MSVETIKAALPALELQIDGINNALPLAPASLLGMDLPLFLNFPGNATYTTNLGQNLVTERRSWKLRLYVAPIQAGVPGEAESLPTPFIESVSKFFLAHVTLGGLTGLQSAVLTADSGTIVLRYANGEQTSQYVGVEFTLNTEEVYRRNIVSG